MSKELTRAGGIIVQSDRTADLRSKRIAENTGRAYAGAIRQFNAWRSSQAISDALVAEYLAELHEQGRAVSTITQVVAAVNWLAKDQGIDTPVGTITEQTLNGIRREGIGRGRGQVDGLTWSEVDAVCAICESDGTLRGLRDAALISLMSDCLLRVSEARAVNCGDFRKNTLVIRKSKTDQEGKTESRWISPDTQERIKRYRDAGNIERGALFVRIRKGDRITTERLTTKSLRKFIQDRAEAAGIEGFISGHSLRVGAAVSLAENGASVVQMQQAGGWKDSNMPAHYARAELAERGAVATLRTRHKNMGLARKEVIENVEMSTMQVNDGMDTGDGTWKPFDVHPGAVGVYPHSHHRRRPIVNIVTPRGEIFEGTPTDNKKEAEQLRQSGQWVRSGFILHNSVCNKKEQKGVL